MDKRFTVEHVPAESRNYIVQRRAVLRPLFGDSSEPKAVARHVLTLVDLWRDRLAEVRRDGWAAIAKDKDYSYARNCRPTVVITEQQTRFCFKRYLCPFCYGREVFDIYNVISKAVFHPSAAECELLTRTKSMRIDCNVDIRKITDNLKYEWSPICDELNAVGAFFSILLAPGPDASIELRLRNFILMPPGSARLPSWLKGQCAVSYIRDHTQLAELVGGVMEYPKQLIHGDSKLMYKILVQRQGLRLAANFGKFRAEKINAERSNRAAKNSKLL